MQMSDDGMGSAWTWNADRQQFYYHAFSARQPDLNLRNTAVRNELKVSIWVISVPCCVYDWFCMFSLPELYFITIKMLCHGQTVT